MDPNYYYYHTRAVHSARASDNNYYAGTEIINNASIACSTVATGSRPAENIIIAMFGAINHV